MRRATALAAVFAICIPLSTVNVHAIDPPSIKPLKEEDIVKVSSSFGDRIHPILKKRMHHNGIDFVVPLGSPVLATADGIVRTAGAKGAYGIRIEIEHDSEYTSRYAQLSEVLVEPGREVKKGDIIGYSGNSGQSTGPHLHYEVLRNGTPVNPADYFTL
jgi:murein DD-endopeptidase MepM/ murein hydrolase activator NlpD